MSRVPSLVHVELLFDIIDISDENKTENGV